ncbi:voltage-gated chloride channel [Spirochaetia bacterium]|nr:voltage-gated chloride channel [Spirochaetia bacterium]
MRTGKDSIFVKLYSSKLAIVFESVIIGLTVGFVIVIFRALISKTDILRKQLYNALLDAPVYWTVAWILVIVVIGLFLGWAAKTFPMIKGSGIPQIKGTLNHLMVLNWKPELPLKILTGVLGIGAGLSLGREGPSIQIGAYVGKGVLSVFHRPHNERKVLVTSAAAAGLAAAFSAPLSGALFAIEELGAPMSSMYLTCTMAASITADAVAGFFFGSRPVFNFGAVTDLPLYAVPWVILLGILCALLGDVFKRTLYWFLDFYNKVRIPPLVRPVLPLLISVPIGFMCFDLTGGGHALIESLAFEQRPLLVIALLLAGKILFTGVCYGSGTAGGIFLPLLACGALLGSALAQFLNMLGFISETQTLNFVILGMAAFFTGVVKAPLTGVILILEMCGSMSRLYALVLVCFTAFVTSDLIGSRPVYPVLLARLTSSKRPVHEKRESSEDEPC